MLWQSATASLESEVKVLGSNAQVWRQDTRVSSRGKLIGLEEWKHPLAERHMQINEEHQAYFLGLGKRYIRVAARISKHYMSYDI